MKDTEHAGTSDPTPEINPSELWKDRGVVSVSFRRHSKYDYAGGMPTVEDRETRPRGSLTPIGISMVREEAKKWQKNLPPDSEVTIFESPSFMVAGERGEADPHLFIPSRARQTASIYEAEVFGSQAVTEDVDDPLRPVQSARRKRADLLGDFMEHVPDEGIPFIDSFFKIRNEIYGADMSRFWHDYITGTMDLRLVEALKKCGGSSSRDLASNFAEFIKENINRSEDSDKKKVDLAITHGETMEAFIYYVSQFMREKGVDTNFDDISYGYNRGFNLHIKGGEFFIETNSKVIKIGTVEDFLDYLNR